MKFSKVLSFLRGLTLATLASVSQISFQGEPPNTIYFSDSTDSRKQAARISATAVLLLTAAP
jgi:hypothetical protein